jgi:hypothetical protein
MEFLAFLLSSASNKYNSFCKFQLELCAFLVRVNIPRFVMPAFTLRVEAQEQS